ncbi:MAG TPA: FAD-dependent oxidoreductase [Solirubrobacteraceae bacterium]|nr:FAD-dependent oxidoreductase [Solirubrobacteraceae bacterium]
MAERHVDVLLIGGGIAAGNCARHLREEGFEGSVALVGREPDPPYNRPPCSKKYLTGETSREDALFRPAQWWVDNDVELLTATSVMKLDAQARVAGLSTREEVSFSQALLATGANVRLLRVDGAQLEGIHYLRAFGNSDAIRADARGASRAVVIGGSYIATEVAASLTVLGLQVTILMQEGVTHERSFGPTAAAFFQRVLEEHGVEVFGDDGVARYEGTDGRVTRVVSDNGRELECDLVVVGAGAVPDTMLAKRAGLELGERGGVRCSARLETSAPGIYAAGDMCEYESPIHGGPVRIEHWDVAFNQGRTAALNLHGRGVDHTVVPYFFSDLADWASLEYVGPAYEWDAEEVLGSPGDGEFAIRYLRDGRLAACLSVGRSDDLEAAKEELASS